MKLNIGDTFSGFRVTNALELDEVYGTLYTLCHTCGSTLYYIDSDDNNKVFGVSFTTLPDDDSGVFHIIEHAVLCGSKKYPVREPFVNLLKTSMNTFLNAITYPDKTVYPVASTNEKDLTNLMDVYLDAVFNPRLESEPRIFMQEGWHREFDGNDITVNGVVYSEMQGAESPDTVCEDAMFRALFPDSPYRFNAGGQPESIPALTYEKCLEVYKRHYAPANAIFFLYGNLDFKQKAAHISSYLTGESGQKIAITRQPPVEGRLVCEYDCGDEEKNNTYIELGYVPFENDYEKHVALLILDSALCSSNQSPLKKAVIASKLGVDFNSDFNTALLQPAYTLRLSQTCGDCECAFKKVVEDTVAELVAYGIPKEDLLASISRFEFDLREDDCGSRPRGVYIFLRILSSVNYGESPEKWLAYNNIIPHMRKLVQTDYFEKIAYELFFGTQHKATVVVKPVVGYTEKKNAILKAEMFRLKATLSESEILALLKQTRAFKEYQSVPDTIENLATLPTLKISDLEVDAPSTHTAVTEINGIKLLIHNIKTNGIAYVHMYFDLSHLNEKELSYATMLAGVLDELPAANYNPDEIKRIIKNNLGEWEATTRVFSRANNEYTPLLCVSYSALSKSLPIAVSLTDDLLLKGKFCSDIIKTELSQRLEEGKGNLRKNGHLTAMKKLRAMLSVGGRVSELLSGTDCYFFMKKEINDPSLLAKKLEAVAKKIFRREKLTVSITTDVPNAEEVVAQTKVPCGRSDDKPEFERLCGETAFSIPGNVNYVAAGANLCDMGIEYDSRLFVAAKMLDFDYLWNEVRAKGGAYGVGFSPSRTGELIFYSYRDPNLSETVDAFKRSARFLANNPASNEDIDGNIISIIADMDKPVSPRLEGLNADVEYFSNYSAADKAETRHRILTTTSEDIAAFAPMFNALAENLSVCAVGNDAKINEYGFADVKKI